MSYFKTAELEVNLHELQKAAGHYDQGFLFGRIRPGYMYQTRSLRLKLSEFTPNSENRRILRKFKQNITAVTLPLKTEEYDWKIAKLGKDFYSQKFAEVQFSANKIKELLTTSNQFNLLLRFENVGYAICHLNNELLHYCYPFYNLELDRNNFGMYMMLQSIIWAQLHGLKYVYLGGATRPADKYKLQFQGLEWWDGENWSRDLTALKSLLN
jgi:arginyl-tRNA--protein-N-Asp/Glu arginylyltransferase